MNSIINVSEATTLALHSLVYIAVQKDKAVKIKEIAQYFHFSETHLAKVLQFLSKKDFVKSNRGKNGGFMLAKPPEEINFDSVYECIESEIKIESCPFHKDSCPLPKCIYGNFLNDMKSQIKEFFSGRYLSDVIAEMEINEL